MLAAEVGPARRQCRLSPWQDPVEFPILPGERQGYAAVCRAYVEGESNHDIMARPYVAGSTFTRSCRESARAVERRVRGVRRIEQRCHRTGCAWDAAALACRIARLID